MRLSELSPKWVGYTERSGMGLGFQCPHCLTQRLVIWFANPTDGGPCYPLEPVPEQPGQEQDLARARNSRWTRAGEDYETLTLSPSIDASKSGHWHGFITNGNIT